MSRIVWGWALSRDDERWCGDCATREAAIAEARASGDVMPGDTFYVRSGYVPIAVQYTPDVYMITEAMRDAACDEAGDAAEDFASVSKAALDELRAKIDAWAEHHCEVTFWIADGEPERIDPEVSP